MDLVHHHSSSSSGSSSSFPSSVSGSTEVTSASAVTPISTHACISSLTNPSLSSSSGLNVKRKLGEIATTDEAQLPRLSVVRHGDLNDIIGLQSRERTRRRRKIVQMKRNQMRRQRVSP